MDITRLILDDHAEQRRLFAVLEEIDRADVASLGAVWTHLAAFLETHAAAEEAFFYPELLHRGTGAGGRPDVEDETEDAIKDHNEIRDAVAAVAAQTVGSDGWFDAVDAANKANSSHMAEEEREALTDFRRHTAAPLRHELAVSFIAFEAAHVTGVRPVNTDPKAYIAEHG